SFLRLGSDGLREMTEQMRKLGLEITGQDIVALRAYNFALRDQKELQEAIDVQIGRVTLPLLTKLRIGLLGVFQAAKQDAKDSNFFEWMLHWAEALGTNTGPIADKTRAAVRQLREEIDALTKAMQHKDSDDDMLSPSKLKEAATEFYGLS